jgi:restriction endonuclease S subunit
LAALEEEIARARPSPEQKRIAGILDAADALRAKRREALAQLDTLLQSTFLDMFGDPVTNPMGWESGSVLRNYINERLGTKRLPFGSKYLRRRVGTGLESHLEHGQHFPMGRPDSPFRSGFTQEKF